MKAIGELFVVESELMQDGCLKVVDVDLFLRNTEPKLICFSVSEAALDSAPG